MRITKAMITNLENSNIETNNNLSKYEELVKDMKTKATTQVDEYIHKVFEVNDEEVSDIKRIDIITKDLSEYGYAITFIEERIDKYLEKRGMRY